MMDALLLAVRDTLRDPTVGLGYDARTCDIRPDGQPVPRCGEVYLAVHPLGTRSDMMNALDEYFSYALTLSMRITIPPDRIGDQLLARKLAQKVGFNARVEVVRALLHMNWGVIALANDLLLQLNPQAETIYGFVEPAHYAGMDTPYAVGGEWFGAEPNTTNVGLVAELRFDDARRLQALQTFV